MQSKFKLGKCSSQMEWLSGVQLYIEAVTQFEMAKGILSSSIQDILVTWHIDMFI